jgi:membrane-bound metal-dependent hydrolase YbcI (DUF457 family)
MPSPVGHAVAGLIVALASEKKSPGPADQRTWLFFVCMFLAALPDIDYLYPPMHRGPTHSMGATVIVLLIAAGVTAWTTGRIRWRVAVVCALAYFSHIVMDWLGADPTANPGVMALWPLSDRLFISGWELFRSTWRIQPLAPGNIEHNALTLAKEMVLLGPILIWLLWRRAKTTRI